VKLVVVVVLANEEMPQSVEDSSRVMQDSVRVVIVEVYVEVLDILEVGDTKRPSKQVM
jgi:hypothetical protein